VAAVAEPQHTGLYSKYRVTHPGSDTELLDVFVLRPSRDPHARRALLAYAAASPDLQLRADLYRWLADISEAEASGGTADFPIPAHAVAALREQGAVEQSDAQQRNLPVLPPGGVMGTCRSCHKEIFWGAVLRKDSTYSGKRSPFEWPPVPGVGHMRYVGDSTAVWEGERLPGFRQTTEDERAALAAEGVQLYTNHFSTCPNADEHRVSR
jgi:hypothetical protein